MQGRIIAFPRHAEEGAGEIKEDLEDNLTMIRATKNSCPSSNQTLPSTLPVASSHCSSTETRPVTYNKTSINCPSKFIRKTDLAEERKIVYVNGTFYFSWNHVLVDDFCVLGERRRSGGVEVAVCLRPSLATQRDGEGCRGVKSCLRKCCPEGFLLQGTTCVCQVSLTNATSVISGFLDFWDEQKSVAGEDSMEVGVGFPKCVASKNVKIDPLSMRSDLALLANGSLWAEAEMSLIDYCVDEEEEEKEKDKVSEEEWSDEMLPDRTLVLITCNGKEILAYFYGPMGVLCLANTIFITQTGLRLYCATDKKCDCLPASCCRNADHTLYRSYMTEALTDTLNTFQGVFIFITFLRSSKKRRLLQEALTKWSDEVAGGGGCDPNLSSSCFPSAVSPNRVLEHLRHSRQSNAFGRWLSRVRGRRSRIHTPQVLDNIIFRGKMGVYNEGFEEDGVEVEAEDGGKRSVCGGDSVNRSFNPMWTAPHWRARWGRAYFPGAPQRSKDSAGEGSGHQGLPGVIKDSGSVSSATSVFYISSSSSSPSSSSPPFTNWSFLRHKSGSLTLGAGQRRGGAATGVVCQGLTRTDPGLP
ncbi:hypothetical protein E2C01_000567 [Portunus trituberculatus]|uniref:Methuselah N-terminal domain-containing protein n=1 Tax=Portunus trituberculatus TaxID=210409 RepID=A0A5B7CFJ3_PORTR|nr:hypothetical protein [Portunus trituberculatus]